MPPPSSELEDQVTELQKKFDRLKVLYEQYFMGIEKIEPLTARKEVTRAILNLQQVPLRQSGIRFKVATLIQKWNIYQSYWNRTLREIEQGRYVRHVVLARRRAVERGVEFPAEEMGVKDIVQHLEAPAAPTADAANPAQPAGQPTAEPTAAAPAEPQTAPPVGSQAAARPVSGPGPTPRPPGPPPPTSRVPGMSDDDLRDLHQRVVAAQRAAGENQEMRYEALVTQLSRQVPQLLQEHGANKIAFDVVTRGGRVKLKPTPQK